jgi:hypothetical protein
MKEVFEELKQRLYNNREHYVYEDVDGDTTFCEDSLMAEIDGFVMDFMKRVQ